MFAKIMSIPDALLNEWFELLTEVEFAADILALVANPMPAKKQSGQRYYRFTHGAEAGNEAESEWVRRFSEAARMLRIFRNLWHWRA